MSLNIDAAAPVAMEEDDEQQAPPDMSLVDITDGRNNRGIPAAKFIDDIDAFSNSFTPAASAELLIGAYSELHAKYKSTEASLHNKRALARKSLRFLFYLFCTIMIVTRYNAKHLKKFFLTFLCFVLLSIQRIISNKKSLNWKNHSTWCDRCRKRNSRASRTELCGTIWPTMCMPKLLSTTPLAPSTYGWGRMLC
jgi:hypothetical protein